MGQREAAAPVFRAFRHPLEATVRPLGPPRVAEADGFEEPPQRAGVGQGPQETRRRR